MVALAHALILGLFIEGVCFALFPGAMRRALLEASALPDQGLRCLGGMALAACLLLAFALRLFA